ncbi:MAG: radical SAM family heme chaperone HemW [Acidobacteriota bacterium]|nr:radical SAM family heme chaperone HemW [Acidobacteriota bacterium]
MQQIKHTSTDTKPPLGIYVHIPFCVHKCYYCDFVSGPFSESVRKLYLEALQEEIKNTSWTGSHARTVFFGGGTPSELNFLELQKLTTTLTRTFECNENTEWSIECNPATMSEDFFSSIRTLGFNRVSLGVQSFNDYYLKTIGRIHTAQEARTAYRMFRQAGFNNINMDLIFAIPGQTIREWRTDLKEAISLSPEHLSLYNLTIEPDTEFGHRLANGKLEETDEDLAADMYESAMELTQSAGYHQYEISNYSRPGLECAHNFIYWRNQPYLGFGVSAASFVGGIRWTHTANLTEYIETAPSGQTTRASEETLNVRKALGEEIMLGLRTEEGISPTVLSDRYSCDVPALFSQTFKALRANGLLLQENERVKLTRRGKMLANDVCSLFLAG